MSKVFTALNGHTAEDKRRKQLATAFRNAGVDGNMRRIFQELDKQGAVVVSVPTKEKAKEIEQKFPHTCKERKERPWQRFAAKKVSPTNGEGVSIQISRIQPAA